MPWTGRCCCLPRVGPTAAIRAPPATLRWSSNEIRRRADMVAGDGAAIKHRVHYSDPLRGGGSNHRRRSPAVRSMADESRPDERPCRAGSDSAVIYHQLSRKRRQTWSSAANINSQVKDPSWASLNTGPGLGIQLQWQDDAPSRNGRLLIPGALSPDGVPGSFSLQRRRRDLDVW